MDADIPIREPLILRQVVPKLPFVRGSVETVGGIHSRDMAEYIHELDGTPGNRIRSYGFQINIKLFISDYSKTWTSSTNSPYRSAHPFAPPTKTYAFEVVFPISSRVS